MDARRVVAARHAHTRRQRGLGLRATAPCGAWIAMNKSTSKHARRWRGGVRAPFLRTRTPPTLARTGCTRARGATRWATTNPPSLAQNENSVESDPEHTGLSRANTMPARKAIAQTNHTGQRTRTLHLGHFSQQRERHVRVSPLRAGLDRGGVARARRGEAPLRHFSQQADRRFPLAGGGACQYGGRIAGERGKEGGERVEH